MSTGMIEVINLSFDYPERSLLHDVNFSLDSGSLLHLRGANGTGKTTLLKLMAGILQPSVGEIRYQGVSIAHGQMRYRQTMCYVGHKLGISQLLTVRENCDLALCVDNPIPFSELVARFSLQGFEDAPCHLLSVGQCRRVALMRLLLSVAPLWLLDEPLTALDAETVSVLMACMTEHLAKNGSIIVTSHQPLPLNKAYYQEYNL
jgi:heme exporter protein A